MTRKRLEVQPLNSLLWRQAACVRSRRPRQDSGVLSSNGICLRFSVLVLSAMLVIGANCHDPYTTNHNLVLLYSNDSAAAFNPVSSLDGAHVYFLADTADAMLKAGELSWLHGCVRVLDLSLNSRRELVPGDYHSLALSPDGRHLLMAGRLSDSSSFLVIADTGGRIEDSIALVHPRGLESPEPQYLWRGAGVVFNIIERSSPTTTTFYSRQLEVDTSLTAVLTVPWAQTRFCVFAVDSLYADSATSTDPAVNPMDYGNVAYAYRLPSGSGFSALGLYDRKRRWKNALAAPYAVSYIGTPAWMPNGHDLLMAANKMHADGGGIVRPYEIWLLKAAVE